MKAIVFLAAFLGIIGFSSGQTAPDFQKKATEKYPALTRQNSPLHKRFLSMYRDAKEREPSLFERANWPILLADRAFAALQDDNNTMENERVAKVIAAAEHGNATAQFDAGNLLRDLGRPNYRAESAKWYRKAAEQGHSLAQLAMGDTYYNGDGGVTKNLPEAARWYRRAAEQGLKEAQYNLGICYSNGEGVPKDKVQAYIWMNLAAAAGHEGARESLSRLENDLLPSQLAEGQRLSRDFAPRKALAPGIGKTDAQIAESKPAATGTGFFLTEDGYLVTNHHVVKDGSQLRVRTTKGVFEAKLVKSDSATDLAVLKVEGKFFALPLASSRGVKLGATVATVGFPNPELQGFALKVSKGEIASLAGIQDNPRDFQISTPVQPGNSGGPLLDEHGNVVGIVVAKLSQRAALATTGTLAENVNYAVKSSYLLSFLESLPEVGKKLIAPQSETPRKFEDVIEAAELGAVLVLVY